MAEVVYKINKHKTRDGRLCVWSLNCEVPAVRVQRGLTKCPDGCPDSRIYVERAA